MKKILLLIAIIALTVSVVIGQSNLQQAGKTKSKKKKTPRVEKPIQQKNEFEPIKLNTFTVFAINVRILYCGSENKDFIVDKINQSFARANAAFLGAAVRFEIDGKVQFACDAQFSNFTKTDEEELRLYNKYCITNAQKCINLFIVDKITNSIEVKDGELGYTYMPYYKRAYCHEFIILSLDGIVRNGTLVHELGHFFGLHHTHGDGNTFEKELVSGANCYRAGDSICDTPADPMLLRKVAYMGPGCECRYVGQDQDPNFDLYKPLTDNIMSYTPDKCRNKFTAGQLNKIGYYVRWNKLTFKHYIDNKIKTAWDTDLTSASIITAKEDFLLSNRGQNALIFVYQKDNTLCQSLYQELTQPYMQEILHNYDYKVVFFDVTENRELIDFFGNDVIYLDYYNSLQRWLRKEIVHIPALITIRFDRDREKRVLTSLVFGYMNPRLLKHMLISNGQIRTKFAHK